jgi:glycosyltransferase involved in cell wall biosynthesis
MDEEPRYRLDQPEGVNSSKAKARVSACVIAKNEEHNLPTCLGPLVGLVDEIIIVDTGSTDRTIEVAKQFEAKVFIFPWVDSFAAARNETLRHATGDWIFWMDADDRLDDANREKLRVLLENLPNENVAYSMKTVCLPDPITRRTTAVDHIRLFRRRPGLRWCYRVHEQILPSIREHGGEVRWPDVEVHHTGYQDLALRQRKLDRDFRLLGLEHGENPNDPFVLFNLGMILHEWRRYDEAVPYLDESLRRSHPTDSIVRKLYGLISQCYRQSGRFEESLTVCREGRRHYPFDLELLFHESVVLKEMGDATGSEACLLHLLFAKEGDHFASVSPMLRVIARHNLAVLCREQGRDGEAEAHWHGAIGERTDYMPCWIGLGELYVTQKRWVELGNVLAWLDTDEQSAVDAAVLRGRAAMAQGDFAASRTVLETAIKREPSALLPRVVLSHALLQEGRDLKAAEAALREILAISPTHAEARRNLAVLARQLRLA